MVAYTTCQNRIIKLIVEGKSVPAKDLIEYVSYLTNTNTIKKDRDFYDVVLLSIQTSNYFEGTGYDFKTRSKSLTQLLNLVYINLKSDPVILEKKSSAIKYVYQLVNDYMPTVKKEKVLSEFRMLVLTSYILGKMGVILSEDEFIESDKSGTYKKYLDDNARYYIKRQEKLRQSRIDK